MYLDSSGIPNCSGIPTKQIGHDHQHPQLPFKTPQIACNGDHKALHRGTLGGLGKRNSMGASGYDPGPDDHRVSRTLRQGSFCPSAWHSGWTPKVRPFPRPPNVPLLRALWSLLDGIWSVLKGSWGVLVELFSEVLDHCFTYFWGPYGLNVQVPELSNLESSALFRLPSFCA